MIPSKVRDITVCEMAPRDGMQFLNHQCRISLDQRVQLIHTLQEAGLPYIEVGSFVKPDRVPAMADTPELVQQLRKYPGHLAALVPNLPGYRKFEQAPVLDTVALFVAADEKYSEKNVNMGIDRALDECRAVAVLATGKGFQVRAHLSAAFRFVNQDLAMPEERVVRICQALLAMGCDYVALADTDGGAGPEDIRRVVRHLRKEGIPSSRLGVHLHDKGGKGLSNVEVAFEEGIRIFDAAAGGIGGNRVIANAPGNVATEDLVESFTDKGVETGIDVERLREAARMVLGFTEELNEPPPSSRYIRGLLANRKVSAKE